MRRFRTLSIVFVGYALFFLFTFRFPYFFSLFCLGLFIGYTFHVWDRLCQLFLIREFSDVKVHFLKLLKSMKLFQSVQLLVEKVPSATSSFYFLLLYFPLAFYVITSTGSVIGTGLVLGLGLSYSIHFILGYKQIQSIRTLFFQPLKSSVGNDELKKLMGAFILAFFVLSLFVLF